MPAAVSFTLRNSADGWHAQTTPHLLARALWRTHQQETQAKATQRLVGLAHCGCQPTGPHCRLPVSGSINRDHLQEACMPPQPYLPIHNMHQRHYGLTKPIAKLFTEAARVCLDRHHCTPTEFDLDCNGSRSKATARWHPADRRTLGAWANSNEATEFGACACGLAAAELSGLVAVGRAETMTGADYYMAPPGGDPPENFENCSRLEVSGIDRGMAGTITQRLKAKLEQAESGNSDLPALAVVVGFRALLIVMAGIVADRTRH